MRFCSASSLSGIWENRQNPAKTDKVQVHTLEGTWILYLDFVLDFDLDFVLDFVFGAGFCKPLHWTWILCLELDFVLDFVKTFVLHKNVTFVIRRSRADKKTNNLGGYLRKCKTCLLSTRVFPNSKLNVFLTILEVGETIFGSFSSFYTFLPLESYLQKCL